MEIFIPKLSPIYIGWTVLQNMGATQMTFLLFLPVEEYQPPTNKRERRKRRRLFANEEKPYTQYPFL